MPGVKGKKVAYSC